jgi:hypothetical protein
MGQMSDARVVIVSWEFAATWVAVAWLWTPTLSEPAPSTSDQPVVTGAISPAPMPAGDEDRPVEFPAIPVIAQAEPRSDSEPVPPQLEAEPSSVLPDSHQTLNVPRAAPEANQLPSHLPLLAEASRAVPRESEAPLLLPPKPKGSLVLF